MMRRRFTWAENQTFPCGNLWYQSVLWFRDWSAFCVPFSCTLLYTFSCIFAYLFGWSHIARLLLRDVTVTVIAMTWHCNMHVPTFLAKYTIIQNSNAYQKRVSCMCKEVNSGDRRGIPVALTPVDSIDFRVAWNFRVDLLGDVELTLIKLKRTAPLYLPTWTIPVARNSVEINKVMVFAICFTTASLPGLRVSTALSKRNGLNTYGRGLQRATHQALCWGRKEYQYRWRINLAIILKRQDEYLKRGPYGVWFNPVYFCRYVSLNMLFLLYLLSFV